MPESQSSIDIEDGRALTQTIFNGFLTKGNIDQARAQLNLAQLFSGHVGQRFNRRDASGDQLVLSHVPGQPRRYRRQAALCLG